jgi:uncharacterized membrane protein YbhN (UPF0104 family)
MNHWRSASRIATWVLGPILVGYLAWYLVTHWHDMVSRTHLAPSTLAMLVALVLVTMLSRVIQLQWMLAVLECPVGFWRVLNLTFSGQLLNYIPLTGTVIQATILKKDNSLKYASFASMYAARLVAVLTTAGVLGLIGLACSPASFQAQALPVWALFAASAVLPTTVLYVPKRLVDPNKSKVHKAFYDVLVGWEMLRTHRGLLLGILGMAAVANLSTAGRIWLCSGAMSYSISYVACLAFSAIINFTFLFNFTPGGLGFREVLMASVAAANGFGYQPGMNTSSLEHGITMVVVVIVGLPCLLAIIRRRPKLPPPADGPKEARIPNDV